MVKIVSGLTFLWLAACAVWSFQRIRSRSNTSVDVLLLALFFFFGLPLAIDLLVRSPQYLEQPGLFLAATDPATRIVSCLYVSFCAALWLAGRERAPREAAGPESAGLPSRFRRQVRQWALVMAVLPVGFLVLSPEPELYATYGMPATEGIPDTISEWHNTLATFTVLSVLAVVVALSLVPRIRPRHMLLALPLVFFDCWVNGKRAIVAIAMVTLGYVLWSRGHLRGRRLALGAAAGLVVLLAFSIQYQTQVRFMAQPFGGGGAGREVYDNLRIDFFRDSRVEMAVFARLNPERMQILEYPGQTLMFDVLFFVPRSVWPDKPWPYAVYFTSSMLNIYPPRSLGWGMTTSWLDEMVSNFGWWGMLVAPLSLLAVCRFGDSFRWPTLSLLTSLVAVLFLALQLSAFLGVFALWILLAASVRLRLVLSSTDPAPRLLAAGAPRRTAGAAPPRAAGGGGRGHGVG